MSLGNLCGRLAGVTHRSCRVLWRPSSIWSGDLSGQAGLSYRYPGVGVALVSEDFLTDVTVASCPVQLVWLVD